MTSSKNLISRLYWLFQLTLAMFLLLIPVSGMAVTCSDLDSKEKIRKFMLDSYESNPLMRKNISLGLVLDACEKQDCRKKKLRKSQAEKIDVKRLEENNRIRFTDGKSAPACLVQRGKRRFICSNCDAFSNERCRSIPSDGSTLLTGTNIDLSDFKLSLDHIKETRCLPLKKNKKYFKIDSKLRKVAGKESGSYDRVLVFYDKEKKVPVTMNFIKGKTLYKVYRFFPKYYVNFGGQWLSTVLRVRSTKGSEKKYQFETLLYVVKEKGKYQLHLDLAQDPELTGISPESLFITD